MTQTMIQPWTNPDWIAQAHAWIEQAVREAGTRISGPVEQPHVRAWGTVMRVPTEAGLFFFKAEAPGFSFEPALTLALAKHRPRCTPDVVAADVKRGWMITRDGGTPIAGRIKTADDLYLFDPILPLLAGLQQEWLGREDELLGIGVHDRRLELLPGLFDRLLARPEILMIGPPYGLDEAQLERLRAFTPEYRRMCERLAACPVKQSIHYDDMHTNNILLRTEPDGTERVTFVDWGDSVILHPFCSMLIFLRAVSDRIGLPESAAETPEGLPPELARLRDVYLEPWSQYDTHANLVEAFNLAWRVGMVARAISWSEFIDAMNEAYRADYRYTVPAWLGEFLLAM